MKKLMIIAMALVMFAQVQAQEEAGNKMWLGGQVSFSTNDTYTIGPSFGMMLTDVLGVGGTVSIYQVAAVNGWSVEPYVRYYKGVNDNFKFYGDGYINLSDNGGGTDFGVGVRPGVQYWFTPDWSMAATLGDVGYSSAGNGVFNLGVNFADLHFSFFWHF